MFEVLTNFQIKSNFQRKMLVESYNCGAFKNRYIYLGMRIKLRTSSTFYLNFINNVFYLENNNISYNSW